MRYVFVCAGVEQVYVHVHRNNLVAQELYQKTGFEVKRNIKLITLKIEFYGLETKNVVLWYQVVEMGQSESSDDTYLLQYTR